MLNYFEMAWARIDVSKSLSTSTKDLFFSFSSNYHLNISDVVGTFF